MAFVIVRDDGSDTVIFWVGDHGYCILLCLEYQFVGRRGAGKKSETVICDMMSYLSVCQMNTPNDNEMWRVVVVLQQDLHACSERMLHNCKWKAPARTS